MHNKFEQVGLLALGFCALTVVGAVISLVFNWVADHKHAGPVALGLFVGFVLIGIGVVILV